MTAFDPQARRMLEARDSDELLPELVLLLTRALAEEVGVAEPSPTMPPPAV